MYEGRTVAAVVPAHNEQELIAGVVERMPDIVDIIVVVDDGSTDETYERAVATGDPRLEVIRQENQGVGGAILTAHRAALDAGSDINVVFAGDGQMDPAYLPALLDPIVHEGYGFTKANRFYSSTSFKGMPANRVFGNVVLSFLTKVASGYWNLFDPQNGYTATSRQALERLDFDSIRRGYEFENDFLINLNILGVRARDVPVPAVYGEEVSGIRLSKVVPALVRLLMFGFWRRIILKYVIGTFSPVALLLFSGIFLTAIGSAVGLWVVAVALGGTTPTTGTVLLAVVPFLMGFQLLLTSLQLDIAETPD
ncbi:MAG: glycosyltransferase family 2 protein [Acidimicrobiia bacterium]|nr:glycosyltransferase family 2 protein [Acidimicrobiia bacterium]